MTLAALASAAVPDLDPVSVEGVVTGPDAGYDVAFVHDAEHRRWVIRCPRDAAAAAELEQSAVLLTQLARRLTIPVPFVRGWVRLPEGGRAAVHAHLPGYLLDPAGLTPGRGLAAHLGRALAMLHNLDPRVYEDAGMPVFDAEGYRARRLADLDRAAVTGRVPSRLLSRWEQLLEDVRHWRFITTPTHGALDGSHILVVDHEESLAVRGFLGWERAQVADPADDFAFLIGSASEEAMETIMEAYAHTRTEHPDRYVLERARMVAEMARVRTMMAAVAAGDLDRAAHHEAALRDLDAELAGEDPTGASADRVTAIPIHHSDPADTTESTDGTLYSASSDDWSTEEYEVASEALAPEDTDTRPIEADRDDDGGDADEHDEPPHSSPSA